MSPKEVQGEREIDLFRILLKLKDKKVKEILKHLAPKKIRSIVAITYNVLVGVISLQKSPERIEEAKKFKPQYLLLAKKNISLERKRDLLIENIDFTRSVLEIFVDLFIFEEEEGEK